MSSPWPAPTPAPLAPLAPVPAVVPPPSKRRRVLQNRQIITDQAQVEQAQNDCEFNSGNNIFSCFPTTQTVIPQHQWASFVWNSRRPDLTQTNKVNVYLFRADSQQQILNFTNIENPTQQAGLRSAQVNDTWFGTQGLNFKGKNVSYPFYWVITRADVPLDANAVPQAIFTAVQTTVLDSVSSSMAAAAASSSSASLASASSVAASLTAFTSTMATSTSTVNPSGAVQHASSSSTFPRWAIAVIVVLGFLAIAATCVLVFLILRRLRRNRANSSRNSIGSASPMLTRDHPDMAQRYDAGSPLLPPHGLGGVPAASAHGTGTTHDGASTISDSGGPFSGADAAIMADAFRKMLRKPDFAETVAEGESPGTGEGDDDDAREDAEEERRRREEAAASTSNIVLSRELAEEGRDIRSVSSSRGVKVESGPER